MLTCYRGYAQGVAQRKRIRAVHACRWHEWRVHMMKRTGALHGNFTRDAFLIFLFPIISYACKPFDNRYFYHCTNATYHRPLRNFLPLYFLYNVIHSIWPLRLRTSAPRPACMCITSIIELYLHAFIIVLLWLNIMQISSALYIYCCSRLT